MDVVVLSRRCVAVLRRVEGSVVTNATISTSRMLSTWRDTRQGRAKATSRQRAKERGELEKYATGLSNVSRPVTVSSVGAIADAFVPLEGKLRASRFTRKGLHQMWETFKKKILSTYSMGKIKPRVKPFKAVEFARTAQEIFGEVNEALAKRNKQKLQELMTENAYQSVWREFTDKHLVWRFVREVERPRIVHARVLPVMTKENLFAQITVRIKTRQVFGVRHRFGKLLRGDDQKERDVIDYVVLERHVVEPLSPWRICGKVAPGQMSALSTQ